MATYDPLMPIQTPTTSGSTTTTGLPSITPAPTSTTPTSSPTPTSTSTATASPTQVQQVQQAAEAVANLQKQVQAYLSKTSTTVSSGVPTREAITPAPTSTKAPDGYMYDGQGNLVPTQTAPAKAAAPTDLKSLLATMRGSIVPSTAAPATPNLVQTYNNLAGQPGGLNEANASLTAAQKELADFEASLINKANQIKGKPVSNAVIRGQLVRLDAEMADAYRQKQNAVSSATDRVNTATKTIATLVDLTNKDYENASQAYNDQYTRNYQMFTAAADIFEKEQNRADTQSRQDRADAQANLKILTDSYTPGKPISQQMSALMDTLQVKIGLQPGTMQTLLETQPQFKPWQVVKNDDGTSTILGQDLATGRVVTLQTIGSPTSGPGNVTNAPAGLTDAFNFLTARMSKDQRVTADTYFKGLLNKGDYTTAAQYLKTTAIANLPSTEQQKAFGRFQAVDALNEIKKDLVQFTNNGGNTDIFSGSIEDMYQSLGATSNPTLATIGNKIALSIVAYRNAVSGAAFTESEAKTYEKIFPSIGKVPELNYAKIQSLTDTLNLNNKSIFEQVLGPSNYDKIMSGLTSADQNPTTDISNEQLDAEYASYSNSGAQDDWVKGLLSGISILGFHL